MAKGLTDTIIEKLKTGSIQNVLLFSDAGVVPEPPYVVVKPEAGAREHTRQYRIIVHAHKGAFDLLTDYCFTEISELLLGMGALRDEEGSRYRLYDGGYTDITADPNDDTFFMERIVYTPMPGIF